MRCFTPALGLAIFRGNALKEGNTDEEKHGPLSDQFYPADSGTASRGALHASWGTRRADSADEPNDKYLLTLSGKDVEQLPAADKAPGGGGSRRRRSIGGHLPAVIER